MSSDIAIKVHKLSKCYPIYAQPRDRLKQFVWPHLQRLVGLPSKQYFKEFWALKDVSFEVNRGETVGIIGRNGSGKSTLLQLICGTISPTYGSVEMNGRVAALLELGSGFNPEFTGRENIYVNAAVLGLSKSEIDKRIQQIEAFADIGDFVNQPVKTYSSGMIVRLAFAVIAHVDADILVVDEALAVGDAYFVQKCMRYIREFQRRGGTLLFVSHDTSAVVNLCTKAFMLNRGQVIESGTPKDIAARYLSHLYESEQVIDMARSERDEATARQSEKPEEYRDMRQAIINSSTLRNDVQVFRFELERGEFGAGGASIKTVRILDSDGAPLSWIVGGEDVNLEIRCVANKDLVQPIVGFLFKDRLGQVIFGDNTYLTYEKQPQFVSAGEEFVANFVFRFPTLPSGEYSISPAIAEGTQESHVQHHWVHDALIVKAHASSICFGLVGIPMRDIKLSVQ